MSITLAAAISAGASLMGTGASIASTGQLNKKNRQWQEDRMREMNAYNSPVQQMQRFREAGLNPHLIYGQGSNGNQSAPTALPEQKLPDFSGIGDAAQNYVAARVQQTQINQMEKNIELADTEMSLKRAQEISTLIGSSKTDEERKQMIELFGIKKEQLLADLKSTNTNTLLAEKQIDSVLESTKLTEEQKLKVKQDIAESQERIRLMKIDGNLKGKDAVLKDLEINLRKLGINPNDPTWMRVLTQMFTGNGLENIPGFKKSEETTTLWQKVKQGFKTWYTK